MQAKKNPKADLESKKGVFFSLGLVRSLAIVLLAFEWKTYEESANSLGQLKVDDIEEEIIPITQQNQPPPPPPKSPFARDPFALLLAAPFPSAAAAAA